MFKKNMRFLIVAVVYLISLPCHATDTLECVGKPYSIMIHVGYEENGEDLLADLLLHKDGHADPIAIYYNKNIDISTFKWPGGVAGNFMSISSKPGLEIPFKLKANDDEATIKVYEHEYSIKCDWER